MGSAKSVPFETHGAENDVRFDVLGDIRDRNET